MANRTNFVCKKTRAVSIALANRTDPHSYNKLIVVIEQLALAELIELIPTIKNRWNRTFSIAIAN